MKGCHRVLLPDNRFDGPSARQWALRRPRCLRKHHPMPAFESPNQGRAPASRIAHVKKMAAARMLRPLIVIPSWPAARRPSHASKRRRARSPEPPFRLSRNGAVSLVRRRCPPHRRPNVPRTNRSARRGWELPSSLPVRQRARRPARASWPHAS
jgi:hypothetical protein